MSVDSGGSRRNAAICGAAAGALFGVFLSLAARGCGGVSIGIGGFRMGGEGWPDGWPLPPWWVLVTGGVVMGAIVGLVAFAFGRIRTGLMSEFADQVGLRYEPTVAISSLAGGRELFEGRVEVTHGFHGEYCGTPVDIVDVAETTTTQSESARDATTRRTIVMLPAERLPRFRLEPRGWGNIVWRETEILFDESQSGSTNAKTLEQFNSRWFVANDDNPADTSKSVTDKERNERAIRRLFTQRVMDSLSTLPIVFVHVRAGRLLVWQREGFLKPQLRCPLLEDALQFRDVFLDAKERTSAPRDDPNSAAGPVSAD
jgi:hypothetical protein